MRKLIAGAVALTTLALTGCAGSNPYTQVERAPENPYRNQVNQTMTMALPAQQTTLYVRSRAPVNPRLDCYAVDVDYQGVTSYANGAPVNRSINSKIKAIKPIPCSQSKGPIH